MVSPTGLLTDPPEIEREVLLHDTFVAIMRPQNRLARRRSLTLADMRDAAWVMPNAHTTMWRQIEALFAAENEPWPMHCVSTNSVTALKSLVIRTDSVSISSARLVRLECEAGHLKAVPLSRPHFAREICLRRRRNGTLTPPTLRFIELLRAGESGAKNRTELRSSPRKRGSSAKL